MVKVKIPRKGRYRLSDDTTVDAQYFNEQLEIHFFTPDKAAKATRLILPERPHEAPQKLLPKEPTDSTPTRIEHLLIRIVIDQLTRKRVADARSVFEELTTLHERMYRKYREKKYRELPFRGSAAAANSMAHLLTKIRYALDWVRARIAPESFDQLMPHGLG